MRKLFTPNFAGLFYFAAAFVFLLFAFQYSVKAQNRINYHGSNLFLSGINAAWVNFAADLGPNPPNLDQFRTEFQTIRNNGGNAMRLWLFTNGSQTPSYDKNTGLVNGPGAVAIQNLKQILSIADHYHVGVILCLWSFDMLRTTELDSARLHANIKMLTDTAYTNAFIRNALIPMVDSVKGDSAIIAWEVCNEPNGMTTGTNYYSADPTVPASAIQKFTNLIAGAIHRTDKNALVTTGPGSFQTLTDVNPIAKESASPLSPQQLQNITNGFNIAHRMNLTTQQMQDYLNRIAATTNTNLYRDDRLISAGGDSAGTLDFYCVHYYSYGSTLLSPFTHNFATWGLTKPTVVAEFYMNTTDGSPDNTLFPTLYSYGYAGALAWSWTDFPNTPKNGTNAANDTWATLQYMKKNYAQDVFIPGTFYPSVALTSPKNNSTFLDTTQLSITAAVVDTNSKIAYVKFFAGDSALGEMTSASKTSSDTLFYTFIWKNIIPGNYSLSAIAENNLSQQEISTPIQISFSNSAMTNLEAETASIHGTGITVKSDPTASGGKFLDIATDDTNTTVTWQFINNSAAGSYPISFRYKLNYDSPKSQYININGVRADTLVFDGSTSSWLVKTINANLIHGNNTVQMQMYWGWMYLDYLAVPTSIITSINTSIPVPLSFSLSQNYPNPFNPSTTINYTIASGQLAGNNLVTLKIYDILGREVKTLVNEKQSAGSYSVSFNADKLASGIYFYTLRAGNFVQTKKMILLK